MKIKILAFGQIAEIAACSEWDIEGIENADSLRKYIEDIYPQLNSLKYLIAVNRKIVHGNESFNDNDTIALLPPFSGG